VRPDLGKAIAGRRSSRKKIRGGSARPLVSTPRFCHRYQDRTAVLTIRVTLGAREVSGRREASVMSDTTIKTDRKKPAA
jgi:hypothetical protein